ncbi:helix-turn-helix transcriptional regulator [Candidatus Dojkabacteria bacterium]|uniref:Helix-turn-helix transcriptional regulator n=1 Tax=Candidatus Dojkabacteria bacterium TaxID=2099670 RepID=A0A955RKT0_9BACT|nr:helix-turn-helix transcriptional regulator [Candidatus Dojkabacteria bacterium]
MSRNIGKKLKKFRNQKGMSQLELEIKIGASAGSISRIESGKVNPTKETITDIIEGLGLNVLQVATLFNIRNEEIPSVMDVTKDLLFSSDLNYILQSSVNGITKKLDLLASVILIIEDDRLYSTNFTQHWYTTAVTKLLPKSFSTYSVSLTEHNDNACVESALSNKSIHINNLHRATIHAYSRKTTKAISRLIGFKSGIILPIYCHDSPLGSILFCKSYEDDFEVEIPMLRTYTNHIAAAINNANKLYELKNKLNRMTS